MTSLSTVIRANRTSAALFGGAVAVTLLVLAVSPPEREVSSLWSFLVKLVPFALAAEGIARLDLDARWRGLIVRVAMPVCFVVFFCYFVPKIFFYLDDFPEVYVKILTLTPFLILTFTLAYRLGGGTASIARRLAFGLLLLMISGIEDLAFLTVNDHTDPRWSTIPDRWTWASHMRVRLGHYPTKYEAFAFIAVHVLAAAAVLFAPSPWRRKDRTATPATPSAPAVTREPELEAGSVR